MPGLADSMWFLHLSPFACEFLPWTTGILDSRTWCPLKASSGRCVMAPIESTWIWTWRKSNQGVSWWISRGQEPTDWYTIFTNNDKQKGCEWIFIIHQSQSLCTFGWVRSWWDDDMSLSIWKRFIMKTNTSSEGTGFFKMMKANLQYKLKQFHKKTYLKQDATTKFFSAVQMECYFPTKNSLNFWGFPTSVQSLMLTIYLPGWCSVILKLK